MRRKDLVEHVRTITLMFDLEVNADMHYKERANKIWQAVNHSRKDNHPKKSNKYVLYSEGINSLLGDGAKKIKLNSKEFSGIYINEVEYRGILFIAFSDEKYPFVINGSLL